MSSLQEMFGEKTVSYMRRWNDCIRSRHVADLMGITTQKARILLDRAAQLGLLEIAERYSYENCRAWKLKGEI